MRPGPVPRLIVLSILVVTASSLPVFLAGAGLVTIGGSLGYGATGLGVLTAVFFLTAAAASAPLGRFVERIGWRRAMWINAAGSAGVMAGIAGFVHSASALGAFLAVGGATYGLANPAANQSLAHHVDPRHRGAIFGLKHAGIPSATLLAGVAVSALLDRHDWRTAYWLAIVIPVVVALLVPRRAVEPRGGATDPRRGSAPLPPRFLVALAGGTSMATWAAVALSSYLTAAAVETGFSEQAAGVLLAIGSAASIASRVTVGIATDRARADGFTGLVILTGLGSAVFATLVAASGGVFAVLVPLAFATGWGWPGLMTFTVVNANAGSAASSSAITQAGIFLGAGVAPIAVGWIGDRWSYGAAYAVVAILLAGAAIAVAAVKRAVGAASAA